PPTTTIRRAMCAPPGPDLTAPGPGAAEWAALDLHHEAVVGALGDGLVTAGQHLGAEGGQDEGTGAGPVGVLGERRVVQVGAGAPLGRIGLAHEENGPGCGCDEAVAPLGVTGVGDRAARPFDAERVGGRAALMLDRVPRDDHRADTRGNTRSELDHIAAVAARYPRRTRKENL